MANSYSVYSQEEIDLHDDWTYDLQTEIKQLQEAISRMFENAYISADMIAEALFNKVNPDDAESLKTIYNSWHGKPYEPAIAQFQHILKRIRSYQ